MTVKATDARPSVLRDVKGRPVIWDRRPDLDIECPLCVFDRGHGTAWAYLCLDHWRTNMIGQTSYWCSQHQTEVRPLMIPGEPLLAPAFLKLIE